MKKNLNPHFFPSYFLMKKRTKRPSRLLLPNIFLLIILIIFSLAWIMFLLIVCCLQTSLTWSPQCYLLRIMRDNSFWQSLDWQIFNKMSYFSVCLFVLISIPPCTKCIIFCFVLFFNAMPNPGLCRFFKVRKKEITKLMRTWTCRS